MVAGATLIGADYTHAWRRAGVAMLIATAAAACLLPLDGAVARLCRGLSIGGDLKRELEFVQQFGAITSVIIVAVAIALLDPRRRARLWDLGGVVVLNALAGWVLKVLIGRPRPRFDDPFGFIGPVGTYPLTINGEVVERHSWEVWGGISSNLWSAPSSHTAAAAALGFALSFLYPQLRWLMLGLVVVVGAARVLLLAHYPADVALGAGLGYAAACVAMHARLGSRVAGRLRFISA
ncbi:MAG: phosphatase PAP2 family protein [Phycisphaerales bacterium]|nr:phosphatase PAP2 family protein [Phycisphaerales bacterium]